MKDYRPGTFDSRVVNYEQLHQIDNEQITHLLEAIDLQPNQKVLDGCCGYGSVTKWLVNDVNKYIVSTCSFFLLDESPVQIERAKENLRGNTNLTFLVGDVTSLPYEDNFFDTVIIKMGLHENPKEVQEKIIREVHRVLKPEGKFVVWELYLNELTQPIFQSFIHKKDELAGFDTLAQKRYFPRGDELRDLITNAEFENFIEHYVFGYELHTKVRFNELISRELKERGLPEPDKELHDLANVRLNALNDFFRNELTEEEKRVIGVTDEGNDIIIHNVKKAIISAVKPRQ